MHQLSRWCCKKQEKEVNQVGSAKAVMVMKSGQCPKCGSHEVFCNTNRKFPALHTITVGAGSFGNRYAPLDIYICVTCGYVESYIAHSEDLRYVKEEWALTKVSSDRTPASTELPDATSYLTSSANGNPYPSPNPSEERTTGNGTASASGIH